MGVFHYNFCTCVIMSFDYLFINLLYFFWLCIPVIYCESLVIVFFQSILQKNMFYDAIWPILRACGLLVLWRCLADDKQETELISYNQYFLVESFLAVMVKMQNKLLYC